MIGVTAKLKQNDFRKRLEHGQRTAVHHNFELAELTVEKAKVLCPVSDNNEPGHTHLVETIRTETDERTGSALVVAGDIEKGVNHAVAVELGTVNMSPEPYMLPAVDDVKKHDAKRPSKMY